MRRKYQTIYLTDDPIIIYEEILSGTYSKFPPRFIDKDNIKKIMRYVFLTQKKYGREQICSLTRRDLHKLHMSSFFKEISCFYTIVSMSFPEMNIKEWELKSVPNDFWKKAENRKRYFLSICKEYEFDIESKKDLLEITSDIIESHHGKKAIKEAGGVYELIKESTDTPYLEWEICKIPKWNDKLTYDAVKWLVEDKLKLDPDLIKNSSNSEVLKLIRRTDVLNYSLKGLLKSRFKGYVLDMIRFVYPVKQ